MFYKRFQKAKTITPSFVYVCDSMFKKLFRGICALAKYVSFVYRSIYLLHHVYFALHILAA